MTGLSEEERKLILNALVDMDELKIGEAIALLRDKAPEICECKKPRPNTYANYRVDPPIYQKCENCGKRIKEAT